MTRPEKISRRKAFNKALRARAAEEQTSFVTVLQRIQNVEGTRAYRSMLNLPTHPDRPVRRHTIMMGDQLHGQSQHTPTTRTLRQITEEDEENVHVQSSAHVEPSRIVVDLMAIAKPAKVKGVAREFEVVERLKNVIVWEDFEADYPEDEWEAIDYDEGGGGFSTKRTYSAALKGR